MLKREEEQYRASLAVRGLELGADVHLSRTIDASVTAVWAAISAAGQLNRYHPYCRKNPVERWPGVGSRDGVEYYSGLYFQRDIMHWREGWGYDLEIGPPPRKSAWISWSIDEIQNGCSELGIRVTPILENHLLEEVKKTFVRTYFAETIMVYLDHLLRGVDQFVTTGCDVQARQFGAHPIYAP